jgi:hypothetical protein
MHVRRAAGEEVVGSTDDLDGGALETARVLPADGDDIVVIPSGPDDPRRRSRKRIMLILAGVAALLLVVGAIALIARNDDSSPTVVAEPATTIATLPVVAPKVSVTSVPGTTAAIVAPTVPLTSVPVFVPPRAVVPPPTSPPPPATTVAPPKQYGASALTWNAPGSMTVASGKTATLAVTGHNPTNGTVTLPHPLSCTPRLDHSEVCPEMVQYVGPGQSASAQYTIDAHGIAPGQYPLRIEGVLTVNVTVT